MSKKIMFYVQHLLGIGHLRRASLLSAAMMQQGLDVLVVLGGRDSAGISFDPAKVVRLPEAYVDDHTFTPLRQKDGRTVDDAWKKDRCQKLLQIYADFNPDMLVIEMFPFGRRQFRFELLPLIDLAKASNPKVQIVSSVRDILVKKSKPGRNAQTAQFVRDHFDVVLVHGDPLVTKLDDTFEEAKTLGDRIRYTGYVAPENNTDPSKAGLGEVIVSAGGGAVGAPLLNAALEARTLSKLAHKTWRFVTGPNYSDHDFEKLSRNAPPGVIIERFRSDLPHMFKNCALSISQGGYNTIMDLLRARATAIVVPYEDGAESEQRHRTELLVQRKVLNMVKACHLSPNHLAEAINNAQPPEDLKNGIDLSGAQTTAALIAQGGLFQ